ncbi:MAG TPA: hypothetical protein DEQ61_22940 [Streptomyces sp.]|nr:hypothetical protein [Streptomyces sp.]
MVGDVRGHHDGHDDLAERPHTVDSRMAGSEKAKAITAGPSVHSSSAASSNLVPYARMRRSRSRARLTTTTLLMVWTAPTSPPARRARS